MAHLSKIGNQWRLRYWITFPEGTRVERSRRFKKKSVGQFLWPVAGELEEKTKYRRYNLKDIDNWKRDGLLNPGDVERLGFSPHLKTLGDAIEEYRQSWQVSPRETASRNARLNAMGSILDLDNPLKNLRYGDGLRMRNLLKKTGHKTATIAKYIQDLKRCLNLQVANQTIEFNPFATLKAGRVPANEKINPVALADQDVSKVIATAEGSPALDGWLKVVLLLAFGCGLRRKEILTARWENINWDERSLEVLGKTGALRKVALGERLYYELLRRKKKEGPVIPRFYPDTVSKAIKKHLKECGHKMRMHDTRHTYTTLIQEVAGASPIQAMGRTGHKDMRMLSLYSHPKFGKIYEDSFSFMKVNERQESEA